MDILEGRTAHGTAEQPPEVGLAEAAGRRQLPDAEALIVAGGDPGQGGRQDGKAAAGSLLRSSSRGARRIPLSNVQQMEENGPEQRFDPLPVPAAAAVQLADYLPDQRLQLGITASLEEAGQRTPPLGLPVKQIGQSGLSRQLAAAKETWKVHGDKVPSAGCAGAAPCYVGLIRKNQGDIPGGKGEVAVFNEEKPLSLQT